MKKIYAIFVSIFALAALVWVIQLTLEGKPVAKIKLSEFETPKNLSDAIRMRLRQELKDHTIVFLGVDPEEPQHLDLWKYFVTETVEPGWKFDEIIIEKGLNISPAWGIGEKIIDLREMEPILKQSWNEAGARDKRIAVIVPSVYSSQLIKDNPVQRLKLNPNEGRFLSLSLVALGESASDPVVSHIPCVAEGSDYTGASPLGCMIHKKAMFWKKPFKNKKYLGIVEQVGLHDYLVYFRNPTTSL